jgi:hypothetical protein
MMWPLSLCSSRSKLVDVRSSMWHDALHPPLSISSHSSYSSSSSSSSSNGISSKGKVKGTSISTGGGDRGGRGSGGTGGKENTHYQSLRLLSTNLHSLHLSTPIPSSYRSSITAITNASLLSISKASQTSHSFSDIDFKNNPTSQASLLSMLQGATQPDVRWERAFSRPLVNNNNNNHNSNNSNGYGSGVSGSTGDLFAQHCISPEPCLLPLPTARHGVRSSGRSSGEMLSHMSAVAFGSSPFAAAILQQAVDKAALASQAGAYAYW